SSIEGEGFKSLSEGDKVEFEVIEDEKGPKATKVTKV
ncbi:MAG: cold-shock protein, partial [Planctomycetota bacterium]